MKLTGGRGERLAQCRRLLTRCRPPSRQVIGQTDDAGGEVTERPIDAPTLHATICTALGMDYRKEYTTAGGRPITFLDPATSPRFRQAIAY